MYPVLFRIEGFTFYSYGLLALSGTLAALAVGALNARRAGLGVSKSLEAALFAIVVGFVGARALYVLVEWHYYREYSGQIPYAWDGGLVFFGGVLLSVPLTWFYARRVARVDAGALFDAFTPGLALGHALGRIGCFLNGCCYGMPCNLPWAVRFTDPQSLANPMFELHPTQLYEAGVLFALFAWFFARFRRSGPDGGRLFAEYLVYYSVARIFLEFYRGDSRGGVGPFSTSMFLGALILGAALLILKKTGIRKISERVK